MNFKEKKICSLFMFFIIVCCIFTQCFANSQSLGSDSALPINEPVISSGSVVLLENSTSTVLFQKDMDVRLEPASVTKILTAILTIENCNLNDVVTVPYSAISTIPSGYSIANLQADEQLTVDQLLMVLMVHSANDAANVLAFNLDGSISSFAERMNAKIQAIGLKDTHFTNPSGMHDENHYSTAHDIALLMQYCIKNSTFKKYASLKSCVIPATNKSAERVFENTNPMLQSEREENSYYYEPLKATKTGFTSQALYCLSSFASNDNLQLICVVLHAESSDMRFRETMALFDYGFQNFAFKDIALKGDVVTSIDIPNATQDTKSLNLVLADSVNTLVNNSTFQNDISPQITLKDIPSAPIPQNKVLGSATYVIGDKCYVVDLFSANNVELSTSKTYFLQVGLLIVVIIVLILLLFFWNKKKSSSVQ